MLCICVACGADLHAENMVPVARHIDTVPAAGHIDMIPVASQTWYRWPHIDMAVASRKVDIVPVDGHIYMVPDQHRDMVLVAGHIGSRKHLKWSW